MKDTHCHRQLESLNYLIDSILALQSPRAIAQSILTQIQRFVPFARGSVMEFNFSTKRAGLLAVQVDYKTKVNPEIQLRLDDFDGKFKKDPEVHTIQDLSKVANRSKIEDRLYREGIQSVLNYPLFSGNELVGLLNIGSRNKEAFSEECVQSIKELAALLTISIRQSRLSEQTRRDNETKSVLVDEINHRVKNNLSAIIGLLYAKQASFESSKTIRASEMIHELVASIQGMSTVHRMLSETEWAPIALSDLVIQIISSVLNMTVEKPVPFTVSPSALRIGPARANSLALIINELTLNFSKHVIPVMPDAQIEVRIAQQDDDIQIEFSDNGPGFPNAVSEHGAHNTGLYLVREMVNQNLKGELKLLNTNGACIRLRFNAKAGEA